MNGQPEDERLDSFLKERKRLLRLAYRYLGSTADSEDVVQEAWLRFAKVGAVDDAGKLLATIVSRICLDRLKSAQARRETYVGPWLPEPALDSVFEPTDDTSLDISFAVMRALERLSPAERAAYFLHDLWDIPFDEVAGILSRSPAACRQLAARARKSLTSERRRYSPSVEQVRQTADAFRKAMDDANLGGLIALLSEDAELISDGGGKVLAALNIIHGAEKVARFLFGIWNKAGPSAVTVDMVRINDQPALALALDGVLDQSFAFDLDEAGRIATIYIIRNPDKLEALKKTRLN